MSLPATWWRIFVRLLGALAAPGLVRCRAGLFLGVRLVAGLRCGVTIVGLRRIAAAAVAAAGVVGSAAAGGSATSPL